ncbi:LLM class flavin-dependent oxidoreductase [Gordonia sp. CPCC 206044]|uniref:LLM class flavin-dependent oxidoreductase n=1 Tax=Gordonia sp. CPCC 206044 TaxID=3140793 RepID=UPI003AF38A01
MSVGLPVGLLYQMWETPDVSTAALVERALGDFRLAADLGFDAVWVGEHHFVPAGRGFYGRIAHPEMLLAKAAAEIPRIRFGTGVKVLPDVSATRAAEEMCMLDLLTGGRADFGVGQGTGHVGDERLRRQGVFRQRLDEILPLLDGDVSADLPMLTFDDGARVRANLWAACRDDVSVAHAARHGLNFVVGQAENARAQADHIRHYRESGGSGQVRGVRAVYIAESRERAWTEFEAAFEMYSVMIAGPDARYTREAVEAGLLPERPQTIDEWLYQANVILGSPDQVAEALADYVDITGVDRLDLLVQFPRLPAEYTRRSMELFASQVWPQIEPALVGG